jgi:hypothetical protein
MRPKRISPETAAIICRVRLDQTERGELVSLEQFDRQLRHDGVYRTPMSRDMLWRLFTGRYYSTLTDPLTGGPLDFSRIAVSPKSPNGGGMKGQVEFLSREVQQLRREMNQLLIASRPKLPTHSPYDEPLETTPQRIETPTPTSTSAHEAPDDKQEAPRVPLSFDEYMARGAAARAAREAKMKAEAEKIGDDTTQTT